jgi:ubiquinone/menaquinone biosynthesis C-methylase UbiE
MYGLGFPAEHFDIVTMDRVLGTGHDPEQAVREAARVLKNGGHLLVVEATGSPVGRRQLVEWMTEAGLTPVEVQQTPDGTALVVLGARRLTLSRAQVA